MHTDADAEPGTERLADELTVKYRWLLGAHLREMAVGNCACTPGLQQLLLKHSADELERLHEMERNAREAWANLKSREKAARADSCAVAEVQGLREMETAVRALRDRYKAWDRNLGPGSLGPLYSAGYVAAVDTFQVDLDAALGDAK